MATWYARMADVPGLDFGGSPDVDRSMLEGADARPRVVHGSLWWSTPQGGTSASPAHGHSLGDLSRLSRAQVVRRTWEGLELPGEAMDYHFILQQAVGELWRRRREDPGGLADVERFAWLDLQLAEADPGAVSFEDIDPGEFVQMASIAQLITILEREGALREALEIARRAVRFEQLERKAVELEAKVAALDAEES